MFTSLTNSSKSKTMITLDSTNSPTAIRSNCSSKFTSKLALTLFYSDKPINPYKQEATRCPSQPKTIKASKTSPLLRVNISKTNDTSSNFTKIDYEIYEIKYERKKTGNPAATPLNSIKIYAQEHPMFKIKFIYLPV